MIATLQELKQYLWITWTEQDAILEILINSSNQMIETYIWRKIEADDYVEHFNWTKQPYILVRYYPIIEVYEIKEEDKIIDDTNYIIETKRWKINFNFLTRRWFQNYTVSYRWWYETIPADLKLASLKLSSKYYNNRWSDWIIEETNNYDRLRFDKSEIAEDIQIILNNYRDLNV